MSQANNNDVSMNSVFLETFRKRKNELLGAEISLDASGISTGRKMTGNSVFLETFRRRKNKQLASELGIGSHTGAEIGHAVSETAKGNDSSVYHNENVSAHSQRSFQDTDHFMGQEISAITDDLSGFSDGHSSQKDSAGTYARSNYVSSDTSSRELTRSQADPASTTSRPPVSSSRPPVSSSRPPVSSSRPPVSSSRPPAPVSAPSASASESQTAKKNNSDVNNKKKNNTKKNTKIAIALSFFVIAICGFILLSKAFKNDVPVDDLFPFVSPVEMNTESDGLNQSTTSSSATTTTTTVTTTTTTTTTSTADSTVTTYAVPDSELRDIQPGEENDDVKKMQQRLAELGYMSYSSCTGFYGDFTKKRIKLFQKNAGLKETGVANVETLKRLYAADAPKYKRKK